MLVALVWGYNWVVMKRALQYVAPFPFLAVRLLIAAACLFALLAALRRPMRIGHWPQVTAIGLVHTAATFALMLFALKFGAAGKTAVLSYAMPFFVTVFAWPILGERPRKAHWLAIFVALAGLVLLFNPSARPGLSELLALASGVTWAAGVVITKRLQVRHHVDTLALSAWQMFVAGVAMLALMWAFPGRPWIWTPYVVFALAFNALVVSALSWVLWFWILGQLEAGVASLGTMVVPGVGLLAGAMELHERLGTIEWSGIMLIFAALAVTGIASLREGRPVLDAKGPI
ncbi:MAG: EamA family transporter [Candidatus Binataceae bacterium]|nr:EamA family transporter [Candidatus Binataceae bacterium]